MRDAALSQSDTDGVPVVKVRALPLVGQPAEAVRLRRELEARPVPVGLRNGILAIRAAIEGNRDDCERFMADRIRNVDTFDPEGLVVSGARLLSRVNARDVALGLLDRAVERGFCCVRLLEIDSWFDSIRGSRRFAEILARAEAGRREAEDAYRRAGGERLLGAGIS